MTYYQPGSFGTSGRPRNTTPRNTRAGWWFWGPFIFGAFFVVFGILFFAGAAVVPAGSGGLAGTGITFVVMGVASLAVAWWAWRDIHSDDGPPEVPGETPESLEAQLLVTGISGQATIKGLKYLAGTSYQGATLVELTLDITTAKGGNVPLTTQSRIPLEVAERAGVGATVPVLISATDPSKLVIQWTGLLPAPSAPSTPSA